MIQDILKRFPKRDDVLLEILLATHKAKHDHAFAPSELKEIAQYLGIPESRVCSVASFYSFFSTKPRGQYVIQVCKDVPCYLNDAFDVAETLKALLSIDIGETTEDGLFTLECASCLGHCDISPAMRVNNHTYGHLSVNKVKAILAELREGKA